MEALATLIAAVTASIVTIVTLIRQGQHRHETRANSGKLQTIEDTLNHTDQEVTAHDGPATLGQRVVRLQRTVEDGFAKNEETHEAIFDAVHQLGQRSDAIRKDVDRAHRRIDHAHPEGKDST